jgi:hypothetical protein
MEAPQRQAAVRAFDLAEAEAEAVEEDQERGLAQREPLRGARRRLPRHRRRSSSDEERRVVPMDMVDNAHSAWGLGMPH